MTHKLRKLGLAFVLALAVASTAATAARGEALQFYAESIPASLSGTSSEDVLTTTVGSLKCSTNSYAGTLGEMGATAVDLTPTSSGCVAFGMTGEVNPNGCVYRLNAGEYSGSEGVGDVDIVCPVGNEITVVGKLSGVTKCTLHIPAQTDVTGTVIYTNVEGTVSEVSAALSLSGIDYTHTKGSGLGACTAGSAANGSYAGELQIGAKVGAGVQQALALLVPKPLYVFNPKELDFGKGGAKTKKEIVVESNTKAVEPKINVVMVYPDEPFDPQVKCVGKTIKKEGAESKCTEEIECEVKGEDAELLMAATRSYTVNTAVLKNC